MAKSYRLIYGDTNEVNRQLKIMSVQNQEGKGPTEKPILMSSAWVTDSRGPGALILQVIIETET